MSLKVLHISYDEGITPLCIHEALLRNGVDSKMLVAEKKTSLDTVFVAHKNIKYENIFSHLIDKCGIRKILNKFKKHGIFLTKFERINYYLSRIPKQYQKICFTDCISHYDLSVNEHVVAADIIHLHWIANFVDFESFFDKVKKPIIWTFHDVNPLMGGFHHFRLKELYYPYFCCLEDWYYSIKKKALNDNNHLSIVAISSFMYELIAKHEFYSKKKIYKVLNPFDTNIFNIKDRSKCKERLGIPANKKVLLFISASVNSSEKGLDYLIAALNKINLPNMILLCIGEGEVNMNDLLFEIKKLNAVNDKIELSAIYSAADIMVNPTRSESFGNTTVESLCCGTPVVMTPTGAAHDIINEQNGIICDDFSVESLIKGIKSVITKEYDRNIIRNSVVDKVGIDIIAADYINVYNSIYSQHAFKCK